MLLFLSVSDYYSIFKFDLGGIVIRKNCIIFDCDEVYAHRLMSYMKSKPQVVYDFMIFTEKKALGDYLKGNEVEVLITSDDDFITRKNEWKVNKYIKLYEEKSGDKSLDNSEYQSVFKYQSTDNIIREFMNYCSTTSAEYKIQAVSYDGKIIGIYSPIGRCGKTSFSLALAQMLGKSGRVLYLNLEEFSGFGQSILRSRELTLSDVLYIYRRSSAGVKDKLSASVCRLGRFDYVPPAQCPEDVVDVTSGEWITFVKYIMEHLGYDYLVIDVGNVIKEPTFLLEIMDNVFMPYVENVISRAKIQEFAENLENMGKKDLYNDMILVQVPEDGEMIDEMFLTEKLEWSKLGSYTRKVINERNL